MRSSSRNTKSPAAFAFFTWPAANQIVIGVLILNLFGTIGCDRMMTPRATQVVKDADAKVANGDFLLAIQLYESALDDSPRSAEIHYRLGLLYDDKMNDPLNALHHFKRYLTITPAGSHASEVKNFMKRDELALVTSLSRDSVVTRTEAARLRNENLNLRKEIEDQRLRDKSSAATGSSARAGVKNAAGAKNKPVPGRSYVVQSGDTLASISRKFYKSRAHWKRILNANSDSIDDPAKLKPGQTIAIP